MARKLITFLGKGRKREGGYQQADYIFDGERVYHTPYFGLALLQELARKEPVDHFLIFGTSESIWDALLIDDMQSDLWLELGGHVEQGTVDHDILTRVTPEVAENLSRKKLARKLSLQLIPFGRDSREQIDILEKLAENINENDSLSMDITHGFRTLPMLGLTSLLLLKELKNVQVQGLYYGAFEMKDNQGLTPAIVLDGLIRIADWLTAISGFKTSGDYGTFSPLLDDSEAGRHLDEAGFLEKTLNISSARSHLKKSITHFPGIADSDPAFRLFSDQLQGYTSWSKEESYAERQIAAARNALKTGNYVNAAALALEAIITAHVRTGNPQHYMARKEASNFLNEQCKGNGRKQPSIAAYMELRDLRNGLAHGTAPDSNSFNQQRTLKNRKELYQRLDKLITIFSASIK